MNLSAIPALAKRSDDLNALQSALSSGNLAQAQGAYAALLQNVQAGGAGNLMAAGGAAGKDLQNLGGALKSGNLSGARSAFSTLLQDIEKSAGAKPVANNPHTRSHAAIASQGTAVVGSAAQAGAVLGGRV